jgi:hypothetical protein
MAAALDYVPLPESLVKLVRETWKTQIKGVPAIASNRSDAQPKQM